MTRIKVYPYKQGSRSAKLLSRALGGKVLRHVGSKYKPRLGDVVVNWGSSAVPDYTPAPTLNPDVGVAQCKLATFKTLSAAGVRIPDCWEGREAAAEAPAASYPLVCRTVLRGHSGAGIVIADSVEELVDAPLYTQYVKKKDEYRVHVMRGEVFFIQRKARKLDNDNPDWRVRNLAGGFVFVECPSEEVPDDVLNQALAAISALTLDFGGVDVIWNAHEEKAYVLEINTACGLEDRTAEKYRAAFLNLIQTF